MVRNIALYKPIDYFSATSVLSVAKILFINELNVSACPRLQMIKDDLLLWGI